MRKFSSVLPFMGLWVASSGCSDDPGLNKVRGVLAVAPAALDFGEVEVGSSHDRTLTIESRGNREIRISGAEFQQESQWLDAEAPPKIIEPDRKIELVVHYTPGAAGRHDGVLLIRSDADEGGQLRVTVTARAFDPCVDLDGDGFGERCASGTDCDDTNAEIHPGAGERCNGLDDNCDGNEDEGFDVGSGCSTSFDTGGGVSCERAGTTACSPQGLGTVCELFDVEDVCDGRDNDCNGVVDDGFMGLGTACSKSDGTCETPGFMACNALSDGTECVADPLASPNCCGSGQTPNSSGVCCAPLPSGPCAFSCSVDLIAGTHDCSGNVSVDELSQQMGLVTVDMSGFSSLELEVDICDATGHWLDVADSPTCNGGGGDANTFSNDAELHASGTNLVLFANDHAPQGSSTQLAAEAAFAVGGCSQRTFNFSDQRFQSFDPCLDVDSAFSLRINPPLDDEGTPDALWYVGLNRVVANTSRSGTGIQSANFCLR